MLWQSWQEVSQIDTVMLSAIRSILELPPSLDMDKLGTPLSMGLLVCHHKLP